MYGLLFMIQVPVIQKLFILFRNLIWSKRQVIDPNIASGTVNLIQQSIG